MLAHLSTKIVSSTRCLCFETNGDGPGNSTKGAPCNREKRVCVHPDETLDYGSLMNAAQADHVGWLWWDWRLLGGDKSNDLSTDGTFAHLTAVGQDVVTNQPNGISRSAIKACRPSH